MFQGPRFFKHLKLTELQTRQGLSYVLTPLLCQETVPLISTSRKGTHCFISKPLIGTNWFLWFKMAKPSASFGKYLTGSVIDQPEDDARTRSRTGTLESRKSLRSLESRKSYESRKSTRSVDSRRSARSAGKLWTIQRRHQQSILKNNCCFSSLFYS